SQIVDNLVDNSIRAVEKTDEKSIDITLKSNADIIFVEIADKGVGIKPEIQEKLLKEQITTKNGQGGFGLYIAKQVLEKYGGSICILQSGPDKKTVFQIQLKRVDNA
ncbi:ATP-binding protein, partial [bacterium]|nr:ATP-binding protein [bacterium]